MNTETIDRLYLELSQFTNAKTAREMDLEDLLCSARAIAERKGENTNWGLFATQIANRGIGGVTPKVFKNPTDAPPRPAAPRVVCLCGSTRFKAAFDHENERLALMGEIVLAPGCFSRSTEAEARAGIFKGCTPDQKKALDELHKRKIDMADYVFVLNVGGYIGESTRGEIEYAARIGVPVKYLEPIESYDPHAATRQNHERNGE